MALSSCESTAVLLTGVTGFLGSRIAAELLHRTSATVYCLVRGRSADGAGNPVRARLAALGVPVAHLERVVPVHGDLALPGLGLPAADFDALAETVDAVYHCGAWLSLVATADRLTPVNVGSTAEVLRLAERGRAKTVHYVSTLAALGSARRAGMAEVDESMVPSVETTGGIGYTLSKMAAERLVRDAGDRGLPVVIHRPGIVLGDTRTGACPDSDILVRIVRAAIELGLAPRCPGWIPVAPVDHVARAVVALSLDPGCVGRTFHLARAEPFLVHDVFRHARAVGYPLADVGVAEWEAALRAELRRPASFVVLAMWEAVRYVLATEPQYLFPRIACAQTDATLAALGVEPCPVPDLPFFTRVLRYLADQQVLAPPPEPVAEERGVDGGLHRISGGLAALG